MILADLRAKPLEPRRDLLAMLAERRAALLALVASWAGDDAPAAPADHTPNETEPGRGDDGDRAGRGPW